MKSQRVSEVMVALFVLMLMLLTSCSFDKTLEIPNNESETFSFNPKIKVDCSGMSVEDYLFMPNITINDISLAITHDNVCETVNVNTSSVLSNPTVETKWEDLPTGIIDAPLTLFTSPVLLKYKDYEADISLSYTLRYRYVNAPNGYIEKKASGHLYNNSSHPDLIEIKVEEVQHPITFVVSIADWEEVEIVQVFQIALGQAVAKWLNNRGVNVKSSIGKGVDPVSGRSAVVTTVQ